MEMGIEPFLVASGVECVVAQRLVRRLCECRRPVQLTTEALTRNGFTASSGPLDAFEPGGCVRCAGTGYRGRIGIYQLLEVTDEIRRLLLDKASAEVLGNVGREQGMRSLRDDGLEKVRQGVTSLSEVLRVTGPANK
jgi:type IV pilus assembly protein PilB